MKFTREKIETIIRESEASVKLEGLNPETNALYVSLRERVRKGEITFTEASEIFDQEYKPG